MKVSAVIPAYNEEVNIAATIEALLAQDYHDLEIIVVDNASTDKTSEVAARFIAKSKTTDFRHIPLKVVYEPKKGLLSARERGRKEATGDIIFNIDADCLPTPDHVSRALKHFKKEHVVAVTGPYDYHDAAPAFRSISLFTQKYPYKAMSAFFQWPFIKKGALLIGGNNFIRSGVMEKAGGYDTSIVFYGEDTDTAKRVAAHGRVAFDPHLIMKTSARRFKAEGTLKLTLKYWGYFFGTIFSSGRPRKK